jgi:teichuronic acid biosynthesis protein TuaE
MNIIHSSYKFFLVSSVIGVAISYSNIYLFHISLILLLFSCLIYSTVNRSFLMLKKLPTRLHYLFPIMFCWYFITLFYSIDQTNTLIYLFYIFCGTFLAITIIYYSFNLNNQKVTLRILYVIFMIDIFMSFLESVTSFRLPISPFSQYVTYFGRENSLNNIAFNGVITYPTGFHWNPNNLATTLAIIFPFFLIIKKGISKYLILIVTFLIIVTTSSRANMISVAIIFLIYLIWYRRKLFIKLSPLFLFLLILINYQPLKVDNVYINSFYESINSIKEDFNNSNETNSITVRKQLIKDAIDIFIETKGIGIGGGGTKAIDGSLGTGAALHNFWLEILVESGILFFIIFVFWYLMIMIKLYFVAKNSKNILLINYSSACLLSLIGFIFGAISVSSAVYLLPMWILFGFSIATINNFEREKKERFYHQNENINNN